MATFIQRLDLAFDRGERARLGGFYGAIAGLHVVGIFLLLLYGSGHPPFIAVGLLAYSLGLRHAFDADHISAIDNTTRKLLQDGKKPVGVGFFFSLGHSSVVFIGGLLLAVTVRVLVQGLLDEKGQLRAIGALIGTGVSGLFLVIIGIVNLVILVDILRVYRRMRSGEYDRVSLQAELKSGGVFVRLFGPLFRFVSNSWQMYPIGFLFGLGFDTTSETLLLATTGGAASQGLPFFSILSLPVLFAAGMSLMDTTDGAFMSKAYSWAFSSPIRKIFYNMTITSLSVFVALFVGLVEVIQIASTAFNLRGGFWDFVGSINFGTVGFIIVGAFVLTWVAAFAVFKLRRVEDRWAELVDHEPISTIATESR